MPLPKAADISYAYAVAQAVRPISLTVGRGAIVTRLGANGIGKTTSVKMIAGLLRPRNGSIQPTAHSWPARPATPSCNIHGSPKSVCTITQNRRLTAAEFHGFQRRDGADVGPKSAAGWTDESG